MLTFIGITGSAILLFLSALHFYWALGGKWGIKNALPTTEKGEILFKPGKFETIIVGLGLLSFSIFFLTSAEVLTLNLPNWIKNYLGWIISSIFFVRAIGDFKYVGLFKRIKSTGFGKADTNTHTPLCLLIGSIGFILEIL